VTLVGVVIFLALQTEWARWAQAPQLASNGPLHAQTISSGWVETSRSGPILRFEGQIRNTGARAIWPGVVQLVLLDAAGERLSTPPIQAGAPIARVVLREASPENFDARAAAASRRFGGTPMAPGEARTFEALVPEDRLPKEAQRVLLEVGESRVAVERSARAPAGDGSPVAVRLPTAVQLEAESDSSP